MAFGPGLSAVVAAEDIEVVDNPAEGRYEVRVGGALAGSAFYDIEPGRVIFLHGIQSHGGWYPRSCSKVAAAGYEVFFLERRGCGLNSEARGDAPSFRRL